MVYPLGNTFKFLGIRKDALERSRLATFLKYSFVSFVGFVKNK